MIECFAKPVAVVHNMMGIASVFGLASSAGTSLRLSCAQSLVDPRRCSGSALFGLGDVGSSGQNGHHFRPR
jgi:hypothetical protein